MFYSPKSMSFITTFCLHSDEPSQDNGYLQLSNDIHYIPDESCGVIPPITTAVPKTNILEPPRSVHEFLTRAPTVDTFLQARWCVYFATKRSHHFDLGWLGRFPELLAIKYKYQELIQRPISYGRYSSPQSTVGIVAINPDYRGTTPSIETVKRMLGFESTESLRILRTRGEIISIYESIDHTDTRFVRAADPVCIYLFPDPLLEWVHGDVPDFQPSTDDPRT